MSTSPKHTPGPWHIDLDYIIAACQFDADGYSHGHIAQVTESFYGDYDADLRLIAAAPELLEAAEGIVSRWDSPLWKDQPHTGVFIDRLRAVIAKAKGEQP